MKTMKAFAALLLAAGTAMPAAALEGSARLHVMLADYAAAVGEAPLAQLQTQAPAAPAKARLRGAADETFQTTKRCEDLKAAFSRCLMALGNDLDKQIFGAEPPEKWAIKDDGGVARVHQEPWYGISVEPNYGPSCAAAQVWVGDVNEFKANPFISQGTTTLILNRLPVAICRETGPVVRQDDLGNQTREAVVTIANSGSADGSIKNAATGAAVPKLSYDPQKLAACYKNAL